MTTQALQQLLASLPDVQVVANFNSDPTPPAPAGPGRFTLVEAARDCLAAGGATNIPNDPVEIFAMAMETTSDFPILVGQTTNLFIRRAYEAAPVSLHRVARMGTANDFKQIQRILLSESPSLEKLNEAGEIRHGAITESVEAYAVETFARILNISRQAITNDPTDALMQAASNFGQSASEREAAQFIALLSANAAAGPTMNDTKTLFHVDHGNLHVAGAGGGLSETSLDTARRAMRQQKGLDGATPINATPKTLMVPSSLETTAEKLLATIQPTKSADANPFANKLDLVVEPRLDAVSLTGWYLVADPNVIDGVEYAYLNGMSGPRSQVRQGWETDGLEIRAILDFGCGFTEWRSWYKSPGA